MYISSTFPVPTLKLRLCFFLLLSLLAGQAAFAQQVDNDVSTYQLTASSGTFTPITGGTNIALLAQADAISTSITIPFAFYYGGALVPTVKATTDGYLALTPAAMFTNTRNSFGFTNNFIAPLWDDLSGVGGTASYVTTGTAPSRVFTFQWLNWRWSTAAATANISFQVKLYEGTNVVQFIYRPEAGAFAGADASASIGLDGGTFVAGDNGVYRNFVSLTDASASAVIANNLSPAGVSVDNINTRPAAGQTYTFTPTNDYCAHATPLAYGGAVLGNTQDASMNTDPRTTCAIGGTNTPSSSAGIFYSLVGNGQTITVSTCSGPTETGGDTKLFVYSGTCGNLTCIANNNNAINGGCTTNTQASSVTFASLNGTRYTIFVQFAQQGAVGPFGLRVTATGLATHTAIGTSSLEV